MLLRFKILFHGCYFIQSGEYVLVQYFLGANHVLQLSVLEFNCDIRVNLITIGQPLAGKTFDAELGIWNINFGGYS